MLGVVVKQRRISMQQKVENFLQFGLAFVRRRRHRHLVTNDRHQNFGTFAEQPRFEKALLRCRRRVNSTQQPWRDIHRLTLTVIRATITHATRERSGCPRTCTVGTLQQRRKKKIEHLVSKLAGVGRGCGSLFRLDFWFQHSPNSTSRK